jgi:hypothetical protein
MTSFTLRSFSRFLSSTSATPVNSQCGCGFDRVGWRTEPFGALKPCDSHIVALTSAPASSWSSTVHMAPGAMMQLHDELAKLASKRTVKVSVAKAESALQLTRAGRPAFVVASRTAPPVLLSDDSETLARDAARVAVGEPTRSPTLAVESVADRVLLFVCAHSAVDARCGTCGPQLLSALEASRVRSSSPLYLHAISHLGGHAFAPNVLVFHRSRALWLAYVALEQADSLVSWLSASDDPLANVPREFRTLVRGTHLA